MAAAITRTTAAFRVLCGVPTRGIPCWNALVCPASDGSRATLPKQHSSFHHDDSSQAAAAPFSSRAGGPDGNTDGPLDVRALVFMDKIHLRGLVFHGFHGALKEENVLGQKFVVDATLYCSLREAGRSDDLDDTVNYAQVYTQIKRIMEGPPHQLLESVVQTISRDVMKEQCLVQGVTVAIKKPHVAVEGVLDSLGIEVTRVRGST